MSAPAGLARVQPLLADSLWLYLLAFVVALSGIMASSYATGPQLTQLALYLTALGFATSALLSWVRISRGYVALALLVVVLLLYGTGLNLSNMGVLLGIQNDSETQLAALLVTLVVVRSFLLFTAGDLVFCAVPSLALLGLLASIVVEPGLVGWFVVFVAACLLMLDQERYLRHRRERPSQAPPPGLRLHRLAGNLVFLVAVLVLGWGASWVMQGAGLRYHLPRLAMRSGTERSSSDAFSRLGSTLGAEPTLPIGTGPVRLGTATVMHVRATRPAYWRRLVYSAYSGRAWQLEPQAGVRAPLPSRSALGAGPRVNEQEYTLELGADSPFCAAADPVAASGEDLEFTREPSGVLTASPPGLGVGSRYQVTSLEPPPAQDLPAPAVWPVSSAYLVHPSATETRRLTQEVIRGAQTPLAKANAIAAYLRRNCRYTLDAAAVPEGEDAVGYFLTRSREGYCDLFASAMAVMCRIAGVPSRLVTGYTEGAYDRERESWRVTEQDAHAWPEVFLPGAGWTAFEPTPAAAPVASEAARRRLQWLVPVLSALLVAVGLLWLAALRLRSPRGEHLPGVTFTGERRAVIETYLACCRLLSRLGFTRPRSRTAGEYLAAITSRAPALGLPELVPPLRRLTQLFTLARYSPAEITPQDTRSAQEDLAGLRAGYRRLARAARVSRRRH